MLMQFDLNYYHLWLYILRQEIYTLTLQFYSFYFLLPRCGWKYDLSLYSINNLLWGQRSFHTRYRLYKTCTHIMNINTYYYSLYLFETNNFIDFLWWDCNNCQRTRLPTFPLNYLLPTFRADLVLKLCVG